MTVQRHAPWPTSGEPDRLWAPTGIAVFPHPTKDTTPLVLRTNVKFNGVRHDRVVVVSVISENVPYALWPHWHLARGHSRS